MKPRLPAIVVLGLNGVADSRDQLRMTGVHGVADSGRTRWLDCAWLCHSA